MNKMQVSRTFGRNKNKGPKKKRKKRDKGERDTLLARLTKDTM